MKNPFQPKQVPALALSTGILGFGLRSWLFASGVDEKGLLLSHHPANALIFILTAATLLALSLCLQPLKGASSYRQLFQRSIPAAVGCIAAAAGILLTDLYELTLQFDSITILSCILGVLAAGSLACLSNCRLRQIRPNPALHGCVTVYLMIHLVFQYRIWSSEPQLQVYAFQLLASVFLMITAYHRTTLDARCGSRRWYVFFRYGALFFSCLALTGTDWLFYLAMAIWMLTDQCSLQPVKANAVMYLPKNVLYCISALEDAGYSAYAVGGCVRDSLLGLTPHDYDLCTCATPEQTVAVFSQHPLVRNGEKHGTVGVILEGEVYEITTFRTEGVYSDSRHPDWVEFVTTLEDDLARRDFTVNAMAYSPATGYIDPWGGRADLESRILRTVGNPAARFQEDALRILRGVRFAARFALTPEEATLDAMLSHAPLMDSLARERVFSELCKLLPYVTAADLIRFAPIITQVIPELEPAVGFQQHSPHHAYDVYTHIAHVVESAPPELPVRLAALLHDIGKPAVFSQDTSGQGHFYGHAKTSAQAADEILLRLKASNALRSQVVFLVEHHMTPLEPDKKLLRRRLGKYGHDAVEQLLALQKADFGSKGTDSDEADYFAQVEALLEDIRLENSCLTVKDLSINGEDILALGIEPGPRIGQCMTFLLELVQDELIPNTREELLHNAKEFFSII